MHNMILLFNFSLVSTQKSIRDFGLIMVLKIVLFRRYF